MARRRRAKWLDAHAPQAKQAKGDGSIDLNGLQVSLADFGKHVNPGAAERPPEIWCQDTKQHFQASGECVWRKFSLPSDYDDAQYKVHNNAVYARPEFSKFRGEPGRVIHLYSPYGPDAAAEVDSAWARDKSGNRLFTDRLGTFSWGQTYEQAFMANSAEAVAETKKQQNAHSVIVNPEQVSSLIARLIPS